MLARYRSVLREPGVLRLVIPSVLARLPAGINALAIVLLVRRATGSFVDAGIVDAGLALGSVLISPGQGRLVDRFGQSRVLIPSAFVSSAALIGLVIGVHQHAAIAVLTVLAAIGGGALPPMSASMREMWIVLIPEPDRLDTAFALEAILSELYFIAGPLLTAVIVTVASPSAAVVTSAFLTLFGVLAFASSSASRRWRAARVKRTFLGPLASPGMRTLVLATIPMGLAFGTLEVAMPALATRHGHPAAAGILLASFCVGSVIGGLLYGTRVWRVSLLRRYLILDAAFAAGMTPLIIAGGIPIMIPLMGVAGLMLAPLTACEFALLEEVAPSGTTIEAFSWMFTATMVGNAAGAAAAGAVIANSSLRVALVIPPLGLAASALLALARRRTLEPPAGMAGRKASRGEAEGAAGVGTRAVGVGAGTGAVDAVGAATVAAVAASSATGVVVGSMVPIAASATAAEPPGTDIVVRAGGALSGATAGRTRGPRFLAVGLVVVAALLGYRARDARADPHRRARRR